MSPKSSRPKTRGSVSVADRIPGANYHPGVTEIEWLASLTPLAQVIGTEAFGRPVRWRVETGLRKSRDRSDVVVEFDDGTIIATGEAKRPDDPRGVTPLDTDEVDDAVGKAQAQGANWCFTTNFHQIGVFDAGPGLMSRPLSRLQGGLIEFVARSHATGTGWWSTMSEEARVAATRTGLRELFDRLKLLTQGQRLRVPVDVVVLDFFSQLTAQLLEPLWRHFITHPSRKSAEIRSRALTRGLNPDDDHQSRYIIAQGIFEVLSAGLFYKVLQDHFAELRPLLGGTTPSTGPALERSVAESLKDAETISGDYETILDLSSIGLWVLHHAPVGSLIQWRALLAFIDRLEVPAISSDVLGSIFERLISPDRRHEMG